MNKVRNILVIVDPTAEQQPAVEKGARLAQQFGARLELYLCDTRAAREIRLAEHLRKYAHRPFIVSCKAMLESLATPLRARGLDVATEAESADPLYAALIARAKRTTADLVVKDTHRHSLARRTLLTNTDWELIRSCPVPLLLTKPAAWAHAPRILAALDPGHVNDKPIALDRRILEHAGAFATALAGELHAVHAYLPLALVAAATAGAPPLIAISTQELADEEQARRGEVAALVADFHIAPANVHVEVGGPVEVLPRVAEAVHADVVVMGAVSRSGLQRIFIGSTAEDVLEHLPCDALIVKPANFAELLPL